MTKNNRMKVLIKEWGFANIPAAWRHKSGQVKGLQSLFDIMEKLFND